MNNVTAPNVVSTQQITSIEKRRNALRARILSILIKKQPSAKNDPQKMKKFMSMTRGIDDKLFMLAKTVDEYSDLTNLEDRIDYLLNQIRIIRESQRRAATTTTTSSSLTSSVAINNSGGGFSSGPPDQYQMVDVYRPTLNHITSQASHFPPLSNPPIHPTSTDHFQRYSMSNASSFGSSDFYGPFVTSSGSMSQDSNIPFNSNPMLRVDNPFTSNHSNLQGMQPTPLPNRQLLHQPNSFQPSEYLAQVSQNLLDRGFHQQARDIVQQGQHSQNLYPVQQPQKQDPFLYKDAYPTPHIATSLAAPHVATSLAAPHVATSLAAPGDHVLSLDLCKKALERQATNAFKPSKLQYQQTPVKDNAIGAQNVSVLHSSQLNSSPSFRPQPQQKRSASVMVQRQSSLQTSTEISENDNGKREQIGAQNVSVLHSSQLSSSPSFRPQPQQKRSASLQNSTEISENNNGKREQIGAQNVSVLHSSQLSSSPSFRPQPQQKRSASLQNSTEISENNNGKREHIGAQNVSVLHSSQLSSSPSFRPQPQQKQSASLQNSTEISENNNGNREHIGAQNVSVLHSSQLNSSPSFRPQPQQKPSASLQNSTEISENNNGNREHIGAQNVSVLHRSQLNSCPSFRPQPQQKPSASLQNSTEISENNNGNREHIGENLCPKTPMQPEAIYGCSSAIAPISVQTVSHKTPAERKRLPDGNDTSSKQVNRDCGLDCGMARRWLLFLYHVRYCKATEDNCDSKFCFKTKKLLRHILSCKVPDCTYHHLCCYTRKCRLHYKQCRDESCRICVFVKNFKKKEREKKLLLHRAKRRSASLNCRPRKSSKLRQEYNKRDTEALSVDDDLQLSIKRPKIERPSQIVTPETGCGVVCKPHTTTNMQEKDGLQSDDYKSVRAEAMPMNIDIPDASRKLENHVAEDTPKDKNGGGFAMEDKTICLLAEEKSKCMNELSAPKEENVKQSVEVLEASKMEISSLVELFTPQQVKEHIRGLRQWVGQSKTKAEKNKAMGCSMSVNSCQLCAVERLVFEPIPIYCSPCGVRIKRNALHYSVAAGESRQCVCTRCYNLTRENSVSFDGTSIPKARLEKKKNDEQVGEGWVQCDKCEAWQHQICALFNSRRNHGEATKYTCPNCYIQEVEKGERRPLPLSDIPGAKDLPVTSLSNHIEERLFKKLKKERQERARLEGKSYEEVPGAESLTVRVVASVDKVLEVKGSFLELFQEENYPSEFPYKSKVILLFQKIENVEVCLFGMFVQEFGTEAGPPNQRRVYLSYLDSVKYFRPEVRTVSGEALRTFVYHEILIGYLDYCKKRGFTSCYIWACPPLKGEDYILYCHPEIQKTPKADKLREWYLAMLRKASKEDVVVECTNLYDHFFVQSGECRANVTAARLPYFDGDYWPGAAEDLIRQMSQEDDDDDVTKLNRKGLTKNIISKRALRAVGHLDLTVNASKDRLLMQKLGETICPLKEDFIMVHLQHSCKHCCTLMVSGNRWVCKECKNFQICDKCNEVEQKRIEKERHPINQKEKHTLFPVAIKDVPTETEDKDDNLESEFFDNRQAFLNLCQGNNYQYDTLRRAKHSSMMILYHLHNPTAPAFATICTICQQEVENSQGWHCQVCPGYEVCNACYSKASINHPHKLISRSSSTDTVVQQNGKTNQNYHQIQMEKMKDLLVHAVACPSTPCQYQGCQRMKNMFRHCLSCKISLQDCSYCKKFWSLIKLHASYCRNSRCTVPKCRDFRATSCRKQQQSDKRRRASVMEMMRERSAEATLT